MSSASSVLSSESFDSASWAFFSASWARRRGLSPGPRPYLQLLDDLQHRQLLPALYFCFSRKECEIKAERNMHRRLLERRERDRIHELFLDICARFELDADRDPELRGILGRALNGTGFHHAGMLPIHKEVVERLFTSGLLKLLDKLLGMDLKLRQYEQGKAFCDGVVARAGIEGLNRVWAGPENLPSVAELSDPDGWLQRTEPPQLRKSA